MSAEGKKKRGISGAANGKSKPFRLSGGGIHPAYMRKTLANLSNRIGHPREGSAWDRRPQGLSYHEA